MIKLDKEVGIDKNELIDKEFISSNKKMDILLLYLRKVHAFDYFSCQGFENERVLANKVSSAFLRV